MARHPANSETFRDVIALRASRRDLLKGAVSFATLASTGFIGSLFAGESLAQTAASSLTFPELARTGDKVPSHAVAAGFRVDVVARWGDALAPGMAEFDPATLTAAEQAKRFGYNCDFVGFLPLPRGSNSSDHGLLCVNNEYISPQVMFPGMKEDDAGKTMTKEQVDIGMAAMGHSVVEIKREGAGWKQITDSPNNRRFTLETEFRISGPAAGHALMKTSYDPTGTKVLGTNYNCSGGVTPWGTVLSGEEGSGDTFGGDIGALPDSKIYERYGHDGSDYYGRARFHDRYNVNKEPNEPHRYDWVVEFDPYDPTSTPVKRTALGRMAHEAATVIVNKDGHVVVYMGDDDYFEYIYRFVSTAKFDAANPAANKDILDDGILSVAQFNADGTMKWLPLVHGQGKLTVENGFASQAEVLIKCRLAADLLGATPMDRPEDMEPNPVTGRIYAVMTKNKKMTAEKLNPANTRPENLYGHIVELIPPGGRGADADHTAESFTWDLFVLCGNPKDPKMGAKFNAATSDSGWFVNPDNIAFDPTGLLWVATDGANAFGLPDGIYGVDTEGPNRGLPKMLFACPQAAEAAGPCFTPDGKTLFVSVQHPAEDSETLDKMTTRWPDFNDKMPARPSVIAISREDGKPISA